MNSPVLISSTAQSPKPCSTKPASIRSTNASLSARVRGATKNSITSGSAFICANGCRSAGRHGRSSSRSVLSMEGISILLEGARHLLGDLLLGRATALVESRDDALPVGSRTVLAQLRLPLPPVHRQLETDDAAQLSLDVRTGRIGDVPGFPAVVLMLLRQLLHRHAEPLRFLMHSRHAGQVDGTVVPRRHDLAVLHLGCVPGRRHV